MTDAHCHVPSGDPSVREFLAYEPEAVPSVPAPDSFVGIHPWTVLASVDEPAKVITSLARLEERLKTSPHLGVGEIGLDRLKVRDLPPLMHEVFERQLRLAGSYGRPVTLHGAKCWGQVVKAILAQPPAERAPAFIFHGFSRSDGLIPDIVRLNGFISIGPAILNDHAVNYREMAKKVPINNVLVETDRTLPSGDRPPKNGDRPQKKGDSPSESGDRPLAEGDRPPIGEVLAKLAELRGQTPRELESIIDGNASRVMEKA